ncbi:hypothetical protein HDU76_006793, partial [Blyttiomyces sp. JEL0837]
MSAALAVFPSAYLLTCVVPKAVGPLASYVRRRHASMLGTVNVVGTEHQPLLPGSVNESENEFNKDNDDIVVENAASSSLWEVGEDSEQQTTPVLATVGSGSSSSSDNNGSSSGVNKLSGYGDAFIPPSWIDHPLVHLVWRLIGFVMAAILLSLEACLVINVFLIGWERYTIYSFVVAQVAAAVIFAFFSHIPAKLDSPKITNEVAKRTQKEILTHLSIFYGLSAVLYGYTMVKFYFETTGAALDDLVMFFLLIGSASFLAVVCFVLSIGIPLSAIHRKRVDGLIPSPEIDASLFSTLTFSWFNPIMQYGYTNSLQLSDLWNVHPTEQISENLKSHNLYQSQHPTSSLIASLITMNKLTMLFQFILVVISTTLFFSGPYFLNLIIKNLEAAASGSKTREPIELAYLYVFGILVSALLRFLIDGQTGLIGKKIGMRVSNVLSGLIYRKALRRMPRVALAASATAGGKEPAAKAGGASVGKIVNLMSVDAENVAVWIGVWYMPFTTAIQILICIACLIYLLGWTAILGVIIMIALFFSGGPITNYLNKCFFAYKGAQDKRVNAFNELLQGIKIIKLFAWESVFEQRVDKFREVENDENFKTSFVASASRLLWISAPIFTTLVTFALYTKVAGRDLDAATAFTSLALFNLLRGPLQLFPDTIVQLLDCWNSFSRVHSFLDEDELEDYKKVFTHNPTNTTLGFTAASFEWKDAESKKSEATTKSSWFQFKKSPPAPVTAPTPDQDQSFRLLDLDLTFPLNKLSVIVGATGSGKSSLLLALLGEMRRIQGTRTHTNTNNIGIAYVSQTAWLTNATIRENILFGSPYDHERYQRVLFACALEKDLEVLEGGDMTEVGFKGINLSGGQKQRIALARAAYSTLPFVVLDDPLSAVDAPTARHLFDHCILGLLQNRTRILVTNAVGLAIPQSDFL